jgi:hypothetical protein
MLRTVIYIPPEVAGDGAYAIEALKYVHKRGYSTGLVPIFRSWDVIDRLLLIGETQVVVVARQEHSCDGRPIDVAEPKNTATPDRSTSPHGTATLDEFKTSNDGTALGRVTFFRGPGRGGGRHRESTASLTGRVYPIGITRKRAAAIIAGEAPIPDGVDPATVAAIRRIARRLGGLRPRQ